MRIYIILSRLLCTLLLCTASLSSTSLHAQAKHTHSHDWRLVTNIQYVTQHYWRGIGRGNLFGRAPAFEPSISLTNDRWQMGVFMGTSSDGIYNTIMPWVAYSPIQNLWVGIWDIYSPGRKLWTGDGRPFDFGLHTSPHFVDLVLSYRLRQLPLGIKWATIIAGKDPSKSGRRNFTNYVELSYLQQWERLSAWIGVGITPWKGLYHADKGGINNIELKAQYTFALSKPVILPVFTKIAYNPLSRQMHFVIGAGLTLPYLIRF